jgi:hypothetical protein
VIRESKSRLLESRSVIKKTLYELRFETGNARAEIGLCSVAAEKLSSPVYCCWPSPAESFLISGPDGTQNHIFVLLKTLKCFEIGPIFDGRRGLTITGHSPFHWGTTSLPLALTRYHWIASGRTSILVRMRRSVTVSMRVTQ